MGQVHICKWKPNKSGTIHCFQDTLTGLILLRLQRPFQAHVISSFSSCLNGLRYNDENSSSPSYKVMWILTLADLGWLHGRSCLGVRTKPPAEISFPWASQKARACRSRADRKHCPSQVPARKNMASRFLGDSRHTLSVSSDVWKASWHAVCAVPSLQTQGKNEFVETELRGQPEAFLRVNIPRAKQSISWLGLGFGLATSKLKCNLGLCLLQAQTLFDALEWKKVPSLHVAMSCVSIGSLTM